MLIGLDGLTGRAGLERFLERSFVVDQFPQEENEMDLFARANISTIANAI